MTGKRAGQDLVLEPPRAALCDEVLEAITELGAQEVECKPRSGHVPTDWGDMNLPEPGLGCAPHALHGSRNHHVTNFMRRVHHITLRSSGQRI